MRKHDSSYHRLFSHPEMLADLCKNFIDVPIYDMLDFKKATCMDTKHFSEKNSKRESDLIYKVPHKDKTGDSYVCLFLEFQSQPDWFMSLRMMVYIGLFYQSLIKKNKNMKKLPAVFPIVLYNGKKPWKAPTSLRNCISVDKKSALRKWQPSCEYCLIDEQRYPKKLLKKDKNIISLLFQLESAKTRDEAIQIFQQGVVPWLSSPSHRVHDDLKHSFAGWILQLFSATLGGKVPSYEEIARLPTVEMTSMLSENMYKWSDELRAEGRQEGRQEGMQIGTLQGASRTFIESIEAALSSKFKYPKKALRQQLLGLSLATLRRFLGIALRAKKFEEFQSELRSQRRSPAKRSRSALTKIH